MTLFLQTLRRSFSSIHRPYKIAFGLISVIIIGISISVFGFFSSNQTEVISGTYEIVTLEDDQECIILSKNDGAATCNFISNIDEARQIVFYKNQSILLQPGYTSNANYVVRTFTASVQRV